MSLTAMLKVRGLILLSTLSGSAMMCFIVSFFCSQNAYATASTIIGTLIGFIDGIYLPVGTLPQPGAGFFHEGCSPGCICMEPFRPFYQQADRANGAPMKNPQIP